MTGEIVPYKGNRATSGETYEVQKLKEEVKRLQVFSDPEVYERYLQLQDVAEERDTEIVDLKVQMKDKKRELEKCRQIVKGLTKERAIDESCANYNITMLQEANRNLKLTQLQANLDTCNCASKLVHARCVMRELEIDLLNQRFKLELARNKIHRYKDDFHDQQRFIEELKNKSKVLESQRDAFHESSLYLIHLLDELHKKSTIYRKNLDSSNSERMKLEDSNRKLENLLALEEESKKQLEHKKLLELNENLDTLEAVKKQLLQETERAHYKDKELEKLRIETRAIQEEKEKLTNKICHLERQLEEQGNAKEKDLSRKLDEIQFEMKRLRNKKIRADSPAKIRSTDTESVDYGRTPQKHIDDGVRDFKTNLSMIEEVPENCPDETISTQGQQSGVNEKNIGLEKRVTERVLRTREAKKQSYAVMPENIKEPTEMKTAEREEAFPENETKDKRKSKKPATEVIDKASPVRKMRKSKAKTTSRMDEQNHLNNSHVNETQKEAALNNESPVRKSNVPIVEDLKCSVMPGHKSKINPSSNEENKPPNQSDQLEASDQESGKQQKSRIPEESKKRKLAPVTKDKKVKLPTQKVPLNKRIKKKGKQPTKTGSIFLTMSMVDKKAPRLKKR